jgi:hypothetical protein
LGDRDAGVDANVTTGRVLEVLHELDQPAFDRCRVGPLPPQRCGRCDVLCDVVDERGERLDLAFWPILRPLVVAATAENGGLPDLSRRVQGAEAVAGRALYWSQVGLTIRRALVNGAPGIVSIRDGKPFSVAAVNVKNGKIVELDFLADPERSAQLDLTLLSDERRPATR